MSQGFDSDSTYCSVFEIAKKKGKQRTLSKAKLTTLLQEITKKIQFHLEGQHLLGNQEVITTMKELSSIKTDINELKCRMEKYKSVLNTIYKRNKAFENAAPLSRNLIVDCRISQDLEMLAKCKNSLKSGVLPKMDKSNSFRFETNMLTNQNFISVNQSSEMINADSKNLDKAASKVISVPNNNGPSDISTKHSFVNSIRFQNSELNDSQFQELKDSTLNLTNKQTNNQCQSKTITQMENTESPLLNTNTISNQTFVIGENNEKFTSFNLTKSRIIPTPNYSDIPDLLTNQNFRNTSGIQNSLLNEEQSLPSTRELSQKLNNSVKDYNMYDVPTNVKKNRLKSLAASNIKSKVILSPSFNNILSYQNNSTILDKTITSFENLPVTEQTNAEHISENSYSNLFSQDLFNTKNTIVEPLQNSDTLISNNDKTRLDNINNNAKSSSKMTNSTGGKLCELIGKCSVNATLVKNYSSLKGKDSADIFSEYMWIDESQSQRSKQISNISKDSSCQILIADSFYDKMDVDSSSSIKSSEYYSRQISSTSEIRDNFKKPSTASKIKIISNSNILSQNLSKTNKKELQILTVPEGPTIVTNSTKSLLFKEKTIEESYDDLCELTNKFLKIGDESNGDDSSSETNFLKNIAKPRHNNDYQEVVELGTGSVNWEDSSENIEETSRMHQVISGLVAEILENINHEQYKISDEETLINQVSNCLDPEDVAKLDINNLIISNRLRIQQMADNFKDQLLTENIEPYTKGKEDSEEELLHYDWRNI